jgi:hypothetical protein
VINKASPELNPELASNGLWLDIGGKFNYCAAVLTTSAGDATIGAVFIRGCKSLSDYPS